MSVLQTGMSEQEKRAFFEDFLHNRVAPLAGELDISYEKLREMVDEMARRGLLGLRVPKEYGGAGLSQTEFRRFQEEVARVSGILAFVQTQHQSACNFVSQSSNEALKKRFLPDLASGKHKSGIAFSQLRRKGSPLMRAEKVEGGYVLSGKCPWITGWGLFDKCVTAAELSSGESVWCLTDLRESEHFKPSDVMKLATFEASQTISAEVKDLFVEDGLVLYHRPEGWIHQSDALNVALQSPFALGCAQAGLDVLKNAFDKRGLKEIGETLEKLSEELEQCREFAYKAMEEGSSMKDGLNARGWAIELAGRCAFAAVIASSGGGNAMTHPAQRVYREALVFAVLAQTDAIMAATLDRLMARG